jgi:hypothetical protein
MPHVRRSERSPCVVAGCNNPARRKSGGMCADHIAECERSAPGPGGNELLRGDEVQGGNEAAYGLCILGALAAVGYAVGSLVAHGWAAVVIGVPVVYFGQRAAYHVGKHFGHSLPDFKIRVGEGK